MKKIVNYNGTGKFLKQYKSKLMEHGNQEKEWNRRDHGMSRSPLEREHVSALMMSVRSLLHAIGNRIE